MLRAQIVNKSTKQRGGVEREKEEREGELTLGMAECLETLKSISSGICPLGRRDLLDLHKLPSSVQILSPVEDILI